MQILVKFEHFILYQEKYDTYYLDKKNKYSIRINSKSTLLNNFVKVYEMFDGIKTQYKLENKDNKYEIFFTTNSNTEYRFDLFKELNTKIYHLSFSLKDSNKYNYEKLTNLNESSEVFAKLSYILQELNIKLDVDEYCIGATGVKKKDNIYKYMMRYVDSWEKRDTDIYELGWALYFKI